MKAKPRLDVLTVIFSCLFSVTFLAVSGAGAGGTSDKEKLLTSYSKLPLYFIENRGQLDPKVRFYTKTSGQTLYFTDEGIVFDLLRGETATSSGLKGIGARSQQIITFES